MSKLLFFVNHLRDGAGMIHRVMGLAEKLRDKDHEVEVLEYFQGDSSWAEESGIGKRTLFACGYRWWLYESFFAYPVALLLLFIQLVRIRPDFVFCELHHEADLALKFRRFLGYKVVFTYHGVADSRFYSGNAARELERIRAKSHRILQKVDRVVVVSDFLHQELIKLSISPVTIYNGIDGRFQSLPTSSVARGNEILFVGRFTEYKGALSIVKAFATISKEVPNTKLRLCGFHESPAYLEEIRRVIDEEDLGPQCEISGPIAFTELPARLRQCRLFVNGSVDETFCMPLLEAQACGTPVVAFRAGGIPEVVADRETGLLAAPEDHEEFGRCMLTLLLDQGERERLVGNLPAHLEKFSYSELASQLENSVLSSKEGL